MYTTSGRSGDRPPHQDLEGKSGTIENVAAPEPAYYVEFDNQEYNGWLYKSDLICLKTTTTTPAPPSPAGYTCSSWSPIDDKQGTNIMQGNFNSSIQQSLNDCANVCKNTNGCEGYSYGKKTNYCYLKKDISSFTVANKKTEDYFFCQVNARPQSTTPAPTTTTPAPTTTTPAPTTTTTQKPFTAPDIDNFITVGLGKCIPFKYENNNNKEQNNLSTYNSGLGAGSKKTHLLNKINGVADHTACGTKCYENIECHAFNYGTSGCVLYKNIDYLSDKTVYSDRNQFEDSKGTGTSNNTACYIKNVLNPPTTIKPSCNLSYIDFIWSDKKICNETKKKIKTNNSVKITKDTKYDSYLIV
jgi:hypothetical protein